MDSSLRHGIILRMHTPYRNKVSLFDSSDGRIDAVFHAPRIANSLVHGGLIVYRLEQWNSRYRISEVELHQLPHAWVCEDILFLHHVLEMALFFIPENCASQHVFRLIMSLYEQDDQIANVDRLLIKQLFLGKFFGLLGIYPEQALNADVRSLFHLFSGITCDMSDIQYVDNVHKKLQTWLLGCINTHPRANTFSTVHFLWESHREV